MTLPIRKIVQSLPPTPLPPDVERVGDMIREQLSKRLDAPIPANCTPAHEIEWSSANGAYLLKVKLETGEAVDIMVRDMRQMREQNRTLNEHFALMQDIAREARLIKHPSPALAQLLAEWREREPGEFEE